MTTTSATPEQLATLQAMAEGKRPVWVVVYQDGDWCCIRCDIERARKLASDSRGILVEYKPAG